jgi:hypothetical protein
MIRFFLLSLICLAVANAEPLSVTTSLGDEATFIEGDAIAFLVSNEQAGYLYLYLADAAGAVTQIFPNEADSENFIPASFYFQIPKLNANYQFTASAPFGEETLVAIFYENKPEKHSNSATSLQNFDYLMDALNRPHHRAETRFIVQAK